MADKKKSKKLLSSGLAVATAAGLILGGTFAWTKVQEAINETANSSKITPELIDEFDPSTGDKNVGVANKGDVPVYVRLRFSEVLAVTNDVDGDGIATNKSNWTNFVTGTALKTSMENSSNSYGYTYPSNGSDWSAHGSDGEAVFHDYFTWKLGNQEDENAYKNVNGSLDYKDSEGKTQQVTVPNTVSIYTYNEWVEAGKPTGDVWVSDNEGYAYYMKAIEPYTASGVYLSGFETTKKPDSLAYYYAIKVGMEVATDSDFDMLVNGDEGAGIAPASSTGKELLSTISPNVGKFSDLKVALTNASKSYKVGDTLTAADFRITSAKDYTGKSLTTEELSALNSDKSSMSISPAVLSAGENNITISFKGASAQIKINASAPDTTVADVQVSLKPGIVYRNGDAPKAEDFDIVCTNAEGETVTPSSISITPETLTNTDTEVTVKIDGFEVKIPVTVSLGELPADDTEITGTDILGNTATPDTDEVAYYCINIMSLDGATVEWTTSDPADYGNVALNKIIASPSGEYTIRNATLYVTAAGTDSAAKDASDYLSIVDGTLVCNYLPTYAEIAPLATDDGHYSDNGVTYEDTLNGAVVVTFSLEQDGKITNPITISFPICGMIG